MTTPPPAASVLADALLPVAAELIATVRDFGPEDVQEVLARVPGGMYHSLAVLLAAMVDPDKSTAELLSWTRVTIPPRPRRSRRLPREHGSLRGYRQHGVDGSVPCGRCRSAHAEDRAKRRVSA